MYYLCTGKIKYFIFAVTNFKYKTFPDRLHHKSYTARTGTDLDSLFSHKISGNRAINDLSIVVQDNLHRLLLFIQKVAGNDISSYLLLL